MIKGTLARKVGLAAIATLTAFAGLAPFAPGASAAANYDQVRYAGTDRFDTAALIAAAIAEATPTAILARADIYPDALTGAFAAAANGEGPMLLTQSNTVPARTLDALEDEAVDNVILLGGPAAISPAVQTQLEAAGYTVERIFGATRYETAIEIAEDGAGIIGTVDGERSALLSSGENFPDALAGAPLSFAAGLPSLLTPSNTDDAAKQALFDKVVDAMNSLNIQQVFLLGGPVAVSQGIEDALVTEGFDVTRLFGGDRHSTSVEIFEFGLDKDIYTNRRFGLARSDTFPDALAYAPLAGRDRTSPAPATGLADTGGDANGLLLTPSCTLATSVEEFLTENQETWTEGEILGGEVAICEDVADEVEAIASVGDAARATVTVSDTDVERGGQITGRIAGENIDSVTVSGCGFTNQAVTRDAEGDFTLTLPQSQTADCTLTFTTTFDDGDTQTDTVDINVTEPAGNATATVRPELTTATLGTTSTTGTTATFCFDEEITGATVPQVGNFHVYAANGDTQYDASGPATIGPNNCVLVNFAAITTASNLVSTLTLATVDFGAVMDNEGLENPIGDAPVGSGQQTTLAAGTTDAPDLLSVSGCAAEPVGAGADTDNVPETRCTFTFDERAYVVDPGGFHLVLLTGEQIDCVAVAGPEGGMPTDRTVQDASTAVVAECQQTASSGLIETAEVARGFVDTNTVSDNSADQSLRTNNNTAASTFAGADTVGCDPVTDLDPTNDCAGNLNALQATDTPDGTTPEPDLVSATLGAATDTTNDTITYTFDETVQAGLNAANFCFYEADGDITCGTGSAITRVATDDTSVLVTFVDGALNQAVGASVLNGAVLDVNGLASEEDEEGMANSNQSATAAGRTDNPDLTAVAVQSVTTGSGTTFRATYTFDEDIDQSLLALSEGSAVQAGDFFLIASDGTRYVATACETRTAGEGTPVGTEDTDNTVVCTAYAIAAANDTSTGVVPTNTALMQAVLGTVDDGAVTEEGAGAGANPEGAEIASGSTGTPTA